MGSTDKTTAAIHCHTASGGLGVPRRACHSRQPHYDSKKAPNSAARTINKKPAAAAPPTPGIMKHLFVAAYTSNVTRLGRDSVCFIRENDV